MNMGEQQSKKSGVRADAQKRASARGEFDPLPASNPVAGAHGKREPHGQSDEETSLSIHTKRSKRERTTEHLKR
jgi:hypothetical protein